VLPPTGAAGLDIHAALTTVFAALAGNRITAKRAATFGYLGQLILMSAPDSARKIEATQTSAAPAKPKKTPPMDDATMEAYLSELRRRFPTRPNRSTASSGRNSHGSY
jgi:hypothetical protein